MGIIFYNLFFIFLFDEYLFSVHRKIIELRKNIWTKEVWHKYYSNFLTGARGGWEGDQLALTANDDTSLVSPPCLYYHPPSPVPLLLVCIVTPNTAWWWHVDNLTNNVTPQPAPADQTPRLIFFTTSKHSPTLHFTALCYIQVCWSHIFLVVVPAMTIYMTMPCDKTWQYDILWHVWNIGHSVCDTVMCTPF